MAMNIAICDDEQNTLNYQKEMIRNVCAELNISAQVYIFGNGKDLIESAQPFDIVFLDIEMGDENGFEIAAKWQNRDKWLIVFLTSHDEYLPDGYKVRAFRFLTKPLDRTKLVETISSAAEVINNRQIELVDEKGTHLIYIKDILYAETVKKGKKIRIVTEEREYFDSRSLEELEEKVSDVGLYRCHRCFLVNFSSISSYNKSVIILKNNENVPLSRRRMQDFVRAFDSWKWRKGSQYYV